MERSKEPDVCAFERRYVTDDAEHSSSSQKWGQSWDFDNDRKASPACHSRSRRPASSKTIRLPLRQDVIGTVRITIRELRPLKPRRDLRTIQHIAISSKHNLTMSDAEQITSLLHAYGAVLSSRSIPDVLNIYTHDGVLMAPGFQPAVGKEALTQSYNRIFSTIKLDVDFTIDEIVVMDGDWAFARTTAAGTKYWLKKDTRESHHNQEIFVCQKVDGVWKIARYCFSSMKPL